MQLHQIGILLTLFTASLHAQNTPNRSLPPNLADFLTDKSPEPNMTSFDIQKLLTENRNLKISAQELQLERIKLMRQDTNAGNVLTHSVWETGEIEVHWENPEGYEEEIEWVKDAVARTWSKHSGLNFVGWNKATSTSQGIRIKISDEGPHCKRLGKLLDGVVNGMVLNFTFQNWCRVCEINRKESIEKIAVHEFGHAIGFAHEQNRPDAPELCRLEERQGTDGDWYITIYDPESIMNYCNPLWNNGGFLSRLDIRAVQILYGEPQS